MYFRHFPKWEDERSRPMEKSDFQNEVEYLGKVEGIIRNRLERLCGEKSIAEKSGCPGTKGYVG